MTRERSALIIIVAHLVAATLYGIAHDVLAVPAGGRAGLLVVAASVHVGPLAALGGLLAGRRTAGAFVLSVSMAAAPVSGLMFHYFCTLRTMCTSCTGDGDANCAGDIDPSPGLSRSDDDGDARGTREDAASDHEGQIGHDDGGFLFAPAAHDVSFRIAGA